MATPVKTAGIEVLAHQAVLQGETVVGAAIDVSTKIAAKILLFMGFTEDSQINTNPQSWHVQISASASGNEDWVDFQEIPIQETGTPAAEPLTATEGVGVKSIAVALTAGFVAGGKIYIRDSVTLADSEWSEIESIVTDTSIEIIDGLVTAKDTADDIFPAEKRIVGMNLGDVTRLRVIFRNEGAVAQDVHIKATMVSWDSFG